jgi:GTP-binding protein
MSFVDNVEVQVRAGKGGDGKLSFRHEKYVNRGGPDGGDGGNGGNIIFKASRNQDTLTAFRYKKELVAESGSSGDRRRKHGKTGQDLIVELPIGTIVSQDDQVLADLVEDDQMAIAAKGGQGGFGNAHFVSSRRQAPNFSEKGEPGEYKTLRLEIKMIADVGLVGLPNAGKSTLLAKISNARPEIADYPFTTLTPNLGVVDIDKQSSLLFADIPGLIEGAAEGKGLGHDFLRHVERTKVILHLIDSYTEDVAAAYNTVRQELEAYSPDLIKRPEIIVLNKVEGLDGEIVDDQIAQLKAVTSKKTPIFPISAQSGFGLQPLLYEAKDQVNKERSKPAKRLKLPKIPVISLPKSEDHWQVKKVGKTYIVTGPKIERFAKRTDFTNEQGLQRLRDIMRRQGIIHELNRKGLKPDQTIQISEDKEYSFKY